MLALSKVASQLKASRGRSQSVMVTLASAVITEVSNSVTASLSCFCCRTFVMVGQWGLGGCSELLQLTHLMGVRVQ